jgi:alpha-beta hydrolase superfamily lysophospholipase
MQCESFTINTTDNIKLCGFKWLPNDNQPIKAVVQIIHGMAEHAMRYERFAKALTQKGFAVYAYDQRGHGTTAGSMENIGFLSEEDGWGKVVDDAFKISQEVKKDYPDMPLFLFGHSMGSFVARSYIARFGNHLDGVVLSATGGDPGLLGKIGKFVAWCEKKTKGIHTPSPLLDKLSFGKFNKAFRPNRTDYDWLSRDNAEVDKYINDPLSGGIFTAGFFYDFLTGINDIHQNTTIAKIPKNLPIYLFSGDKDPVGNFSKGVLQVARSYQLAGIKDVEYLFYKDGRHEMLNEINREDVYKDIISWFNTHLS